MADEVIKKARVLNANLPPILSSINKYLVRYRIRSNDKNRASHWSPFIFIDPEYVFFKGSLKHTSSNSVCNAIWDQVIILKSNASIENITNKYLHNDLAQITTSEAHYLNVGDYVTVSNVDSIFNGTYIISGVTTTPTHTFSYHKNHANIVSTPVSPNGSYSKNYVISTAKEYDVWIRWDKNDGGDWIYKNRIQGASLSVPHPTTYTKNGVVQSTAPNKISIEVYIPGNPASRSDGVPGNNGSPYLKVYQLLNQTI